MIAVPYLKLGHNARKVLERQLTIQTSRKKVLVSVRLDVKGHMINKNIKQIRCQFPNCKGKLPTFCSKCDITLSILSFAKFYQ